MRIKKIGFLRGPVIVGCALMVVCAGLHRASSRELPSVGAWAYQLQQIDPQEIAANDTFDLVVIDYSSDGGADGEWMPEQIDLIQSGGKLAIAYISIGEAENYRFYWDPAWDADPPAWLGPENPDWEGNYKVRFWEPQWQAIIEEYLDRIVGQGFDGIYMDIIDAYYFWSEENGERPDADALMVQFVAELRSYLTEHHGLPEKLMIPQNGEFLIVEDDVTVELRALYLDSIDAIGVEDVFCPGGQAEDNPFDPDTERLTMLNEYLAEAKPVFSIEYLTQQALIDQYVGAAFAEDYQPYVSLRALDVLMDGIQGPAHLPQDERSMPAQRILVWPNPSAGGVTAIVRSSRGWPGTLRVYDPGGRLVQTIDPIEARTRSGRDLHTWVWSWHGLSRSGRPVESGVYRFRVDPGASGDESRAAQGRVVIVR